MPSRPIPDDECVEALRLYEEHGEYRAASEASPWPETSFIRRVKQAKDRQLGSFDGFKIGKRTTLRDSEGKVKLEWEQVRPDDERRMELFKEALTALAKGLPRVTVKPPKPSESDLLAVYPVGDHHLGQLSWHEEVGDDYDLEIGERLLTGAIDYLVSATGPCKQALVVFLGDFMHYDSFVPETPTNKNRLDADSRFPKMVRVAIKCMRYLIEAAAGKHDKVHVIIEIGNHDLASSIFFMECMSNIYENDPRITIDTSPQHYHYYRFGKCLIGTHHGHGAKMESLPLLMAADRPEDWGETVYRTWLMGHIHHRARVKNDKDFPGCTVESLRVLAPRDAHHQQKGYRSPRDMQAIILHSDFGEQARHTVNPEMLR